MIKTVGQTKVADIFSINSNKIYRIPKYQREYTWGIKEWDALFNDIIENASGYFLGSYICVSSSALQETTLEIIDGQQRFTTISLLMVALYDNLSSFRGSMNEDEVNDLTNLKNELVNKNKVVSLNGKKNSTYTQKLFLQKQNMNDEDYSYILAKSGIISQSINKPSNFGNRRISKAYKRFCKLIEDEIAEKQEENPANSVIDTLFAIVGKVEDAVLVGIEVDSNKDAYMLFESLNHRGVPLSALDLIKNTLILQAESDSDTDACYDKWKQILNNIGPDDYAVQERFFRQYYNAFREELNEPYQSSDKMYYLGYLATRTTLLDIYEKLIKSDYQKLLSDLLDMSEKYSIIVNNTDEEYCYTSAMQDLERIAGAPSYILLLYLLSKQEELGLSDQNIDAITHNLITFFVRRNITDIPSTRKLTQLFMDLIAKIKLLQGNEIVSAIKDGLKEVSVSDSAFEEKLRGNMYDENPDATRFILCSIESQHQTKEIYANLWARDQSKKYIWTIEHIFPEGENIPNSWIDMIADGNPALAKQYRSEYVHTLGNLTITGYNQNLSNLSFDKKKNRKSKDGSKELGYRNGLYLNEDVVSKDKWTIEDIANRTDKLVGIFMEMFSW